MPLIETTGSGSAKALGLNSASGPVNYIEDVFSTYLYTGNGTSQTITNGIDLSVKGGLVWLKSRSDATENLLYDTARGTYNYLISSTTGAQSNGSPTGVSSFNTTGFGVAGTTIGGGTNANGSTYVSWTFREQAKFFDVVTYTGDGSASRSISHNLGSVPGCVIVKRTDTAASWLVFHRSVCVSANQLLFLDRTDALTTTGNYFPNGFTSSVTSTSLNNIGSGSSINASGGTYVAYLFAHDAGGFGLTGTDNVISCGSVSVASGISDAVVNLGYEPQWVLWRNANVIDNWYVFDNMRGIGAFNTAQQLNPNLTNAESAIGSATYPINITSTGFSFNAGYFGWGASSNKFIYVAIRRGPMKTPTSGTSVFTASAYTPSVNTVRSTNFPVDLTFSKARTDAAEPFWWLDRLRGYPTATGLTTVRRLESDSTAAETTGTSLYPQIANVWNAQYTDGQYLNGTSSIFYLFGRAPGFFDEVCYTGNGTSGATQSHNLGVVPEMMIVKVRNDVASWLVYHKDVGNTKAMALNSTIAPVTSSGYWNNTTPTSSVFTLGSIAGTNGNALTFVNYLFASCPGVSKVGSYSGTGATQTISCGFAARFVLIKRTDSTGNWWIWDTARGMVAGTDPRLALNLTDAETNANWVYTDASGFQIVTTDATVNASGGSYIYLAIA